MCMEKQITTKAFFLVKRIKKNSGCANSAVDRWIQESICFSYYFSIGITFEDPSIKVFRNNIKACRSCWFQSSLHQSNRLGHPKQLIDFLYNMKFWNYPFTYHNKIFVLNEKWRVYSIVAFSKSLFRVQKFW